MAFLPHYPPCLPAVASNTAFHSLFFCSSNFHHPFFFAYYTRSCVISFFRPFPLSLHIQSRITFHILFTAFVSHSFHGIFPRAVLPSLHPLPLTIPFIFFFLLFSSSPFFSYSNTIYFFLLSLTTSSVARPSSLTTHNFVLLPVHRLSSSLSFTCVSKLLGVVFLAGGNQEARG